MVRGLLAYLTLLYVAWIPFHQYTHRAPSSSVQHQHDDAVFADDLCLVCDGWMRYHSFSTPEPFSVVRAEAPYFYLSSSYTLRPLVTIRCINSRGPPSQRI